MPLGLIFSILLFAVLAVAFFAGLPGMAAGLRLLEILIGSLMTLLAVGLSMRRPWARWIGAVSGLLLAWIGVGLALSRGAVVDILVLLSGVLVAVLLFVPGTGDVRRSWPGGSAERSIPGLAVGVVAGLLLVGSVALFTMAVTGRPSAPPRRTVPGEPGLSQVAWNDFATGLELAESEGKPMLVDFYAVWCGPCKTMDEITFRDASVVAGMQDVIPVRIDAEGEEAVRGFVGVELADKYKVYTYPTLALIDHRQELISRSRGAMGPAQFLGWLEGALARHRRDPDETENQPEGLAM